MACFRALHSVADYLVLNISSPNTVGLRELQTTDRLERLIQKLGPTPGSQRDLQRSSIHLDDVKRTKDGLEMRTSARWLRSVDGQWIPLVRWLCASGCRAVTVMAPP